MFFIELSKNQTFGLITIIFSDGLENPGRICSTIRAVLLALVLLIAVIILITSTKPVAYLQILKSSSEMDELPLSSLLLFLFDVGLCLITTALHVCGKIYQMNQDSKLQKEIIELEIHLNRNFGNTDSSVDVQVAGPPLIEVENEGFMVHKQTLPVVIFMASSMMIMVLLLLNFSNSERDIKIDFWWSLTVFIGNQGLLVPISSIICIPTIRIYSKRRINCLRSNVTSWFTSKARKWERRPLRKIAPISIVENEMNALECIVSECDHGNTIA